MNQFFPDDYRETSFHLTIGGGSYGFQRMRSHGLRTEEHNWLQAKRRCKPDRGRGVHKRLLLPDFVRSTSNSCTNPDSDGVFNLT